LRINNVSFSYHIDYINRRIHLLEAKGNSVYQSLANAMSPQFKKQVIDQELLLEDTIEFEWIVYSFGGLVLRSIGFSLDIVSKEETYLHKAYLEAIKGV
jgi:hypothetical protein